MTETSVPALRQHSFLAAFFHIFSTFLKDIPSHTFHHTFSPEYLTTASAPGSSHATPAKCVASRTTGKGSQTHTVTNHTFMKSFEAGQGLCKVAD